MLERFSLLLLTISASRRFQAVPPSPFNNSRSLITMVSFVFRLSHLVDIVPQMSKKSKTNYAYLSPLCSV